MTTTHLHHLAERLGMPIPHTDAEQTPERVTRQHLITALLAGENTPQAEQIITGMDLTERLRLLRSFRSSQAATAIRNAFAFRWLPVTPDVFADIVFHRGELEVLLDVATVGDDLPWPTWGTLDQVTQALLKLPGLHDIRELWNSDRVKGTVSDDTAVAVVNKHRGSKTSQLNGRRVAKSAAQRLLDGHHGAVAWATYWLGMDLTPDQIRQVLATDNQPALRNLRVGALLRFRDDPQILAELAVQCGDHPWFTTTGLADLVLECVTVNDTVLDGWLARNNRDMVYTWLTGGYPANPATPAVARNLTSTRLLLDLGSILRLRSEHVERIDWFPNLVNTLPGVPCYLRHLGETVTEQESAVAAVLLRAAHEVIGGEERLWAVLTGESKVFSDAQVSLAGGAELYRARWAEQDRRKYQLS
jgi:hypothetical protein